VPLRSESINKLWGSMMFPISKKTMPQKKFPARLANGGQPTISGLSLIQISRLNSARRVKRFRKEQDLGSFHDLTHNRRQKWNNPKRSKEPLLWLNDLFYRFCFLTATFSSALSKEEYSSVINRI
jgi:hypothetical protein